MLLRAFVLLTHSSRPHSSLRGMTAYVRMYRCRRRDSDAELRNLLIIELKSISLASLRRSSCGLHKKVYRFPSEPLKTSFLGCCSDGMISTRSLMSVGSAEVSLDQLTNYRHKRVWERLVRF